MKIALISFLWDRLGGAVAIPQRLAGELARLGHDVSVITTHEHRRPVVREEGGITVYRFRPGNIYWVGHKDDHPSIVRAIWQLLDTWNPGVYRVVARLLGELRPDLVHVHKLRGLSPSVWQAARRAGVSSVVQTCHDYELISPVGTLEGRVGHWSRDGHPLARPYQLVRARASRVVDIVSAPSRYLLDMLCSRGLFPSADAQVVPNFHDVPSAWLGRSAPAPKTLGGRTRLAFLGRLEPGKGIELLLNALASVEEDCELLIAGWGAAEPLVRTAAQGDDRIRFMGKVRGEERGRLLSGADIVVVPSTVEETFGIVVVEAYARGTPVIASHRGALPSLVREGVTGWLFDPRDENGLARLVRRAIREPDKLASMRAACQDAAQEYTLERVVSRYLELYDQALIRRRATVADGVAAR